MNRNAKILVIGYFCFIFSVVTYPWGNLTPGKDYLSVKVYYLSTLLLF